VELTGPQVRRKDTNFHTAVSVEETVDYTQEKEYLYTDCYRYTTMYKPIAHS
jgi:hypothetical protein